MNDHSACLRHSGRLGLLLVLLLAAACSTPAQSPATAPTQLPPVAAPTQAPPTADSAAPPQVPGMDELAPAADACSALEPAMVEALGTEITTAQVPFTEPFSGMTGTACELSARDTGAHVESVGVLMDTLQRVFESEGWSASEQYAADGPTGSARGFRQGDVLALAVVGWAPSPDADCPKDRPISDCKLAPEQRLYTVAVQCVQGLEAQAAIAPAAAASADLQPPVAGALAVDVTTAEAPFTEPFTGQAGTSARLAAEGTGADFESPWAVMDALQGVLESRGWTEEGMYAADGPTGTARGFRQGAVLALVIVGWDPSPDADCPEDQPISECELAPEQMLYTITIDCVQGL